MSTSTAVIGALFAVVCGALIRDIVRMQRLANAVVDKAKLRPISLLSRSAPYDDADAQVLSEYRKLWIRAMLLSIIAVPLAADLFL